MDNKVIMIASNIIVNSEASRCQWVNDKSTFDYLHLWSGAKGSEFKDMPINSRLWLQMSSKFTIAYGYGHDRGKKRQTKKDTISIWCLLEHSL